MIPDGRRERQADLPIRTGIAAYAAIAIAAAALVATHALEPLERAVLDAQFKVLRVAWPRPAPREVVLVGIDEESVKRLPEPFALWHRHFGKFLQATAAGGASAVGLDVVMPDRSYDSIAPGYDKALLVGILTARRGAPLVLGLTIDPDGRARSVHNVFLAAAGGNTAAYLLLPLDGDGVVRRFDEHLGTAGEAVPTLAGQMARGLGVEPHSGVINYARGSAFGYVPLHTVLALYDAGDTRGLAAHFSGKPVLLGSVLQFEDRLAAPVNLTTWDKDALNVPGVVLHAQALRNLLDGSLIATVPAWLTFALCLVAALAWFFARSFRATGAIVAGGILAIAALSTGLLAGGRYLPAGTAFATLVLAAGARSTRETVLAMRERRKMRAAFSGYVSPAVMEEIMAGHINPELGGVNRFVCVLFSDIRGYTTRSEAMTPQQIVALLNDYFEQVVNIIHAHDGTVIDFMGDGIMAIFGAPKAGANPCADAYDAARDLLEYVQRFNARFAVNGVAPLELGVGLHAGDVVVGHVGSSSRHSYTAIGDVTNVASRLEGVTKDVGYRLVYSVVVAGRLPAETQAAHLGFQQIKGHTPVDVYGYDKIAKAQ